MSDGNPLVAAPVDTATPFSGAGILDSGTQLASAIESGDWVAGGLAAFGTALDAAATLSDPFGSLLAAGLGWLMDHFEPLKGWLNDLTGDAGEVQGFARTWANAAQQLQASGQELTRVVGDVDELAGEAIEAYRRFQADAAKHINGAAEWAGAMSTGLSIASSIVQVVHDLVRDVIAQLVGSAISWAAEVVFSLTLATPWVIEQVATRVASLAEKVGSKLTKLLESVKALTALLEKLKALLSKADGLFRGVLTSSKGDISSDMPRARRSRGKPTSDDLINQYLHARGIPIESVHNLRRTPVEDLLPHQIELLKDARSVIPPVDATSDMVKVIPASDVAMYASGKYTGVSGFMARAEDVDTSVPLPDVVQRLRLDYNPGAGATNPFTASGADSYGYIEFRPNDAVNVITPTRSEFGGTNTDGAPFTGNGFTGTPESRFVPEYQHQIPEGGSRMEFQNGDRLWVNERGSQRLLGAFDKELGRFVLEGGAP